MALIEKAYEAIAEGKAADLRRAESRRVARELAAAEGKADALRRAESRRVARELAAAEKERERRG